MNAQVKTTSYHRKLITFDSIAIARIADQIGVTAVIATEAGNLHELQDTKDNAAWYAEMLARDADAKDLIATQENARL